jgi:hypothetical protein
MAQNAGFCFSIKTGKSQKCVLIKKEHLNRCSFTWLHHDILKAIHLAEIAIVEIAHIRGITVIVSEELVD